MSQSLEEYDKDGGVEMASDMKEDEEQISEKEVDVEPRAKDEIDEDDHDYDQDNVQVQDDENADLERIASSKPSVNNIRSVPNGGVTAWMQVVMSFFLFFNTWGVANTFGAYQTYYEKGILASSTPSDISWIGSLQVTLLMTVGSLTGPIYDAGYARQLVAVGTVLVVLGQMMLSLATEYYQVVLAQAVCIGLGSGCLFIPGVAVLSTYFSTRLATAIGLAASGSSLGGIIYPIVFHRLQVSIGFPWATRAIGFIMLGTLVIPNALLRIRVLPGGRRKIFDWTAWTEIPFVFFTIGFLIGFLGLYTPFYYISSYAIQTGLADPNLAFYLLAMINAGSIFGRILPNLVADRIGPFNVIIPCTLLTGVLGLCLIPTHSIGPVIAIAVLYGFTSGTFVSLPGTILVHVTPNRALIGTRMGMCFTCASLGVLLGTPIAGWILDASGYKYVWVFVGIMTVVSSMLITVARVAKGGWSVMKVV